MRVRRANLIGRVAGFCITASLILTSLGGWAAVLRVDLDAVGPPDGGATWPGAFPTIQSAVDAATTGDEIWVAAGSYAELVTLVDGVELYGGFAAGETLRDERNVAVNVTIIDASLIAAPNHVVVAGNGTVIDGFTIMGGDANSTLSDEVMGLASGGGLFASGVSVVVTNCMFTGNSALFHGGAVFLSASTATTMTNCQFEDNSTLASGGAVSAFSSDFEITDCRFENNSTSGIGGAVQALRGSVTINASIFSTNSAAVGGAFHGTTDVIIAMTNCVFFSNSAGDGGALSTNSNAFLTLLNCSIGENIASGILKDGTVKQLIPGGALINDGAAASITNSVLWGNVPVEISNVRSGISTVVSSIIAGGHAGAGNMDVDPRFRLVEAPFPLQLSGDSPAIDSAIVATPDVDVRGVGRPLNGGPDIGAYEFDTDSDGGGLPDNFEILNGLDSSDPTDDVADNDGDNLDNLEEFRRGTNLNDANDPPSQFFVSTAGNDETGDGSLSNPWRTIAFAMASVPEGNAVFLITVNLSPGTYEELVVINPYTRLVSGDAAATTIQFFDSAATEHNVVVFGQGSALRRVTVTTPNAEFENVILAEARNIEFACEFVVFNGKDNPDSLGLFVVGSETRDSPVTSCTFRNIGFGIQAVDASPVISLNTFVDIRQDAIFVNPPDAAKGVGDTPQAGDETDAATGFNKFERVTGVFVNNLSASVMKAELNDWGVFTEAEITGKMSANVDFMPFLTKSTIPGTLAGQILNEQTGAPLPSSSAVSIMAGAARAPVDSEGRYLFQNLKPESTRVTIEAEGFCTVTRTITIIAGILSQVNFSLTPSVDDTGEVQCATTPVASCGFPSSHGRGIGLLPRHAGDFLTLSVVVFALMTWRRKQLARSR